MMPKSLRTIFCALVLGLLLQGVVQAQVQEPKPFTPCAQNPAYIEKRDEKLKNANAGNKEWLTTKFNRYDTAYCGTDGYPHLFADGRLSNLGDFVIPSLLFLYLAGALGWAGRLYLAQSKGAEDEYMIDLPKALKCMALSLIWPLQAIPELLSGKIRVPEDRVTISPR